MAEFEAAYQEKLVPILKAHGLAESSERGLATVEGVFSRLFEVASPSEVSERRETLQKDAAWQEILRDLGVAFGTPQPDNLIQNEFMLYAAPAGPGRVVPAGRGRGHWRTYDMTDGLAGIIVSSILQDREGHLWFGTWGDGVSRYDGQSWTTFTTKDGLAHNHVQSIVQDREGHLWFGTRDGVSRYDGKIFVTFTIRDGLANNRVMSILQDREGVLWFGTFGDGVSRYDGKTFSTFTTRDGLTNNRVVSILQDREGVLWFGTWGDGVSRYDGKRFTAFTTRDGLASNRVYSILQDREGALWFGALGGGVSRYDGKTFSTFTTRDGLADNGVTSTLQDQEGYIWFGTHGSGVSRYDPLASPEGAEQKFTTFTSEDGLGRNFVLAIFQDREGALWFGTDGGGVSRYDSKSFTTFTTQDGLAHNDVVPIFQDREGVLWFGTYGGGVSRYDGKSFITFAAQDGLAYNNVASIFQDQEGHLWFGTWNGVTRYDGQSFTTFTTQDGLAGNSVRSILQDGERYLWFCTNGGGVSRYDGKSFTTFTTQDGLAHNTVDSISQDQDGYLWFSTRDGVSRYDGQSWATFTVRDGLASNSVERIFQDREGVLWFGTWDGVSRYDGKTFTTFTVKDGLAGNRVRSILQDRDGVLWFVIPGGGVSRYDGQVFQTMTHQDGLAGNRVDSILQDRDGYLWFSTSGGVTRYRPPAPSPPPAFIDAVVADQRYEDVSEVSIPSTAGVTIFEFYGMSLKTRPDGMVYRYRLKGYDKDWRNTRQRRVEYQDLPVGDYTFEVVAVDRDLVYSEKPATVEVTVVPDPRLQALTEALSASGKGGEFIGTSQALRRAQAQLSEVAWTDMTVLILGETGTGKGLAARAVHALSPRNSGPFIQVNCGAIPEGLVESELFGHEKGAFTDAVSRKLGKVEVAEEGTLFLDEIGDMPLGAQVKLLRFLEERTFERVGGTQTLCADARVIAATNRDLKQMVSEGKFREDLYFRLQTFPVRLPPLRERREDIPLLANAFMARMAAHLNKNVTHLTPEAFSLLNAYDWPGNVRELEHAVQRAVVVCRGPAIRAEDILLEFGKGPERTSGETLTLEENERRHIEAVLEQTGWVIEGAGGAAALLGLPASTLRSRMKKLSIRRG